MMDVCRGKLNKKVDVRLSHFCAYPKPGPRSPMVSVSVITVFLHFWGLSEEGFMFSFMVSLPTSLPSNF